MALNVYFYLTNIFASSSWLFHLGWEHLWNSGEEGAFDPQEDVHVRGSMIKPENKKTEGVLPSRHCSEAKSPENSKELQFDSNDRNNYNQAQQH